MLDRLGAMRMVDVGSLGTLARASHDGVVVWGQDGVVLEFNAIAEQIFGRPRADMVGADASVVLPTTAAHPSAVTGVIRRNTFGRLGDGRLVPVDVSLCAVDSTDRSDRIVVAFVRQGASGRAEDLLGVALAVNARLAVLIFEIDDLRDINITYGHACTESVLVALARRLELAVPPRAAVGRLDGGGIAIGIPDLDKARVDSVAADLVATIAEPVRVECRGSRTVELSVTACVGIALAPQDGTAVPELLAHAESALATATRSGRSERRFYEAGADAPGRRLAMSTNLRRAIADATIDVVYQPIFQLETDRLLGFEALARWRDPELGVVPPDEFVAMASMSQLIDSLFDVVMTKALAAMAEWNALAGLDAGSAEMRAGRALGGRAITVGLNISARQLCDHTLARRVLSAAEAAGVSSGCIVLELTETAMMAGAELTEPVLNELAEIGVRIVIDDYGVGYSNLSRLVELAGSSALDVIKLDRTFISPLPDKRAETLVKLLLEAATSLGLVALAEGIETDDQLDVIRKLGIVVGQGWLLGRPMSRDDAVRLVAAELERDAVAG